jgi:hypothetical protein
MGLKPVSLRLDEEEYEKLRECLKQFGDPDINVAYVLRAYIRDLNRALPFYLQSGRDLKNYFGQLGVWLKYFGTYKDHDSVINRMMFNPWTFWSGEDERDRRDQGSHFRDSDEGMTE